MNLLWEGMKLYLGLIMKKFMSLTMHLSRDIFGEGARLSHILYQKKPGLYTVEDLLKEDN